VFRYGNSDSEVTSSALARPLKSYYFNTMTKARAAKFPIGAVVKHRLFPFRGVVFDIDPEFANTEEWYNAIPAEIRPRKDQPFYHLFAENAESEYIAYVSEQNLLPDESGEPVRHPQVREVFQRDKDGSYRPRERTLN
jgi:heat shock protein HspQ